MIYVYIYIYINWITVGITTVNDIDDTQLIWYLIDDIFNHLVDDGAPSR